MLYRMYRVWAVYGQNGTEYVVANTFWSVIQSAWGNDYLNAVNTCKDLNRRGVQ